MRMRSILYAMLVLLATTACQKHQAPGATTSSAVRVLTLDFEKGSINDPSWPAGFRWHDRTSRATAQLDGSAHGGVRSFRLSQEVADSAASVVYFLPDSLWKGAASVELSGWFKTREVHGGWAGLAIRADGADRVAADSLPPGRRPKPLAIDVMQNRGPSGTTDWKQYETRFVIPAGTQRLMIGVLVVGTGSAWADDIELSVQRAHTPPSEAALSYARAAVDSMRAHAYHGSTVPWDSIQNALPAALNGATNARDTYTALDLIARRVNRHSEFLTPEEMAALGGTIADTTQLPPLSAPEHRLLSGHIGYVAVPAYVGMQTARSTRYADALQSALVELDRAGACAYIVDLRQNKGGNMYPMIAGVGALLGSGKLGSFVSDAGVVGSWSYRDGAAMGNDGGRDSVLARVSHTRTLKNPAAPVAVLIGPSTASSGEALAISFRGRANTRFFGQATAGLTTGNSPIVLSDGAAVNVTFSVDADRTGRVYDAPIEPDETVPQTTSSGSGENDPCVRAAMAWCRVEPGCAGR